MRAKEGEIDKKRVGGRAREREEGKEGKGENIQRRDDMYRRESEGKCVCDLVPRPGRHNDNINKMLNKRHSQNDEERWERQPTLASERANNKQRVKGQEVKGDRKEQKREKKTKSEQKIMA